MSSALKINPKVSSYPRTWPGNTVAKRNKYNRKLTIDGVDVIFDPAFNIYVEVVENNSAKEKDFDLRVN